MKTISIIAVVLNLAITGYASARIGETVEECSKRYDQSPPIVKSKPNWFGRDRVGATCRFRDGKCVSIYYSIEGGSLVDPEPFNAKPRFTKSQAMKLLALNAPSSEWTKKEVKAQFAEKDFDGVYVTKDGKLQAVVNVIGVSIETVEFGNAEKLRAAEQAIDSTIDSFSK